MLGLLYLVFYVLMCVVLYSCVVIAIYAGIDNILKWFKNKSL